MQTPQQGTKRARADENFDPFRNRTPADLSKRRRRARSVNMEDLTNLQAARAAAAKAKAEAAERARIDEAVREVQARGFTTVFALVEAMDLYKTQHFSSNFSRQVGIHGRPILDIIRRRQPDLMDDYMAHHLKTTIREEADAICEILWPGDNSNILDTLSTFSFPSILEDAERVAPTLLRMLRDTSSSCSQRRDGDLVVTTVLCMLAQARSEKSSHLQTIMCLYLLACGASRSQFDILNHAGFTLSYTSAIGKIKELGKSKCRQIVDIVHTQPCMIIWDNLNIAFRVGEQRQASKDHFDNGTTATLVPLFDVSPGSLPLDLKPPRTTCRPVIEHISPEDLLPSLQQVNELETEMIWHIEDLFFDAFPSLRTKFAANIPPPPSIFSIPVHKTEQYPLPTMHIDESSLDGTIDVLRTIISDSLKMDGDDIKNHGIFLCAGDQLSISLLDKASASRRDDTNLADNIAKYTEGQLGLFHIKMAGTRMVANEFWGVANSASPWSLWRLNSLLGRKPLSAGWSAKSATPFRPVYDLMISLALPAHILEGFRVLCPQDSLDSWAKGIKSYNEVHDLAVRVYHQFCSSRRVSHLRRLKTRDVPLENIILFIRDSLILRALKFSIKRGDVGTIINILAYWMVMFRGTGKMPKYADALFQLLAQLRRMNPTLRDAFLKNWLANLSGRINGFKEMDLLQEHQNFWAKVIYNARGSNRSWSWLAMVSVSIFALRDVIRQVQETFKVPYNSPAHTSPDASKDIQTIQDYLRANSLMTFTPSRPFNDVATPSRDLFVAGAAYSHTSSAFKNFRRNTRTASNLGAQGSSAAVGTDHPDEVDDLEDFPDSEPEVDFDDLLVDEDEFPLGIDPYDLISAIEATIPELSMDD